MQGFMRVLSPVWYNRYSFGLPFSSPAWQPVRSCAPIPACHPDRAGTWGGMTDTQILLGSASPRRRDLLARAGVAFEVLAADIDERARPGEAPRALAERLAREKAHAVAARLGAAPRRLVLGADTIVVLGGDVLGKPADPDDAVRLLSRLVGRAHAVLTGVAVVATDRRGAAATRVVESRVVMRAAEEAEIRRYVATGEPLDKAGAYAAQGEGRRFIERIEGSETNVIGLPLAQVVEHLRRMGA
jgi:septum formation protein